jgi:hypothetical protein
LTPILTLTFAEDLARDPIKLGIDLLEQLFDLSHAPTAKYKINKMSWFMP